MKIIKFFCMMLICSVVPTLWSCDDEDIKLPIPEPEEPELGLVWEDYKALVAEFPDAKNNFIEARYTLNNVISETAPEDIKATEVEFTGGTLRYSFVNRRTVCLLRVHGKVLGRNASPLVLHTLDIGCRNLSRQQGIL